MRSWLRLLPAPPPSRTAVPRRHPPHAPRTACAAPPACAHKHRGPAAAAAAAEQQQDSSHIPSPTTRQKACDDVCDVRREGGREGSAKRMRTGTGGSFGAAEHLAAAPGLPAAAAAPAARALAGPSPAPPRSEPAIDPLPRPAGPVSRPQSGTPFSLTHTCLGLPGVERQPQSPAAYAQDNRGTVGEVVVAREPAPSGRAPPCTPAPAAIATPPSAVAG
jgi:hypothetical protein